VFGYVYWGSSTFKLDRDGYSRDPSIYRCSTSLLECDGLKVNGSQIGTVKSKSPVL